MLKRKWRDEERRGIVGLKENMSDINCNERGKG